ncbi:hypothetical protein HQN86_12900 [Pedobacter panaciterrae]|uniref:hypothetical protein n=1 Tax=Pedobacter panaciterrae TaxID=363849 RepID=UPI00155D99F6|nr:hypothetical protein [Pedobacter panaciterrae]NQX54515.1 hypothetical protein [Pedobacter panaciterrae]
MKNRNTPKPGSAAYNTEKPQHLNVPEYHSSSDRRMSYELPATENLNDQADLHETKVSSPASPKPNLGNPRNKDEDDREKLITP